MAGDGGGTQGMATTHRLILASASEGRRELLTRAGYRFEVMPADIAEPSAADFVDPRTYVAHVAWLKAAAVAAQVDHGLVIAADSTSWQGGGGIGKPIDEADARRILGRLAGTTHQLWTGVCIWRRPDDWQVAWQEESLVEMKALSPAELDAHIASGVWQGKAGGYAIQEPEDPWIRVVRGTVSNVIGLPIETLARVLAWIEARSSD